MKNATVIIANLTGQTIYSGNIRGNRGDFDLSAFAAGVYFLSIEEGGNKVVKKNIKQ